MSRSFIMALAGLVAAWSFTSFRIAHRASRCFSLWFIVLWIGLTISRGQTVIFADGFETPALSGHALGITGDFTFGVWTGHAPTSGGNAGVVRGADNGLAPAEGLQHFAFNGGNPPAGGWIETTLATTPGVDYVVDYALGRGGAIGQLLNVKIEIFDATTGATLNADLESPPQVNAYGQFSLGWTALGDTRIRFMDISGANQVSDLWLDAVSVHTLNDAAAIPETVDWAQFAGFAALGIAAKRHKMRKNLLRVLCFFVAMKSRARRAPTCGCS